MRLIMRLRPSHCPSNNPSPGFTLIELLVSIAIFSMIGLGAYQMLDAVIKSDTRVRSSMEDYSQLTLALSIMQRDFNQFVPRTVRDQFGDRLPALTLEGENYPVEFTRDGWANPTGAKRSRLQRVAWKLDEETNELKRYFWLVLDRAEDSTPVEQVLLTEVTDFRVTVPASGKAAGPGSAPVPHSRSAQHPLAVEVVITTERLGDVVRIFELVEPFLSSDAEPPGV